MPLQSVKSLSAQLPLSLTPLILNFNLSLTVDWYIGNLCGKSNFCLLMSDGNIRSYTFLLSQSDTKMPGLAVWACQIIFFVKFV